MFKLMPRLCACLIAGALSLTALPTVAAPDAGLVRRTELARQLVRAEGMEAQTREALVDVMPLVMGAFKGDENFKDFTPAEMQKLEGFLHDALSDAVPELVGKYAEFYASTLTEAQLTELTALYETPAGKAYSQARMKASANTAKDFELIGGQAGLKALQKFLEWKSKQ